MAGAAKIPGSSRDGDIDTRSTDASGPQADEVVSHAERVKADTTTQKDGTRPRGKARDERSGALKDQTAR